MTTQQLLVNSLLVVGVLAFALSAAGVLLIRDFYDQLHYLAPGSLLGAIAIPVAVLVKEGFSQAGAKAIAIGILLALANPVLSHATARAARVRRKEQWMLTPEEAATTPEESPL